MKRIVISLLLATTACSSGNDSHEAGDGVQGPSAPAPAQTPSAIAGSGKQLEGKGQMLAQLDVGSHSIELYELAPGALAVVEDMPLDGTPLLETIPIDASAKDIYEQFAAETAPAALTDFDARARMPADAKNRIRVEAPQVAAHPVAGLDEQSPLDALAPGVQVLAGPKPVQDLGEDPGKTEFANSHCEYEPSFGLGTDPARVRGFCYPEGRTGIKTESATANILVHQVASIFGTTTYTATTLLDDGSPSTAIFTIAANRLKLFRLTNGLVWYDVPCPHGAVCSGVMLPRVGNISGIVNAPTGTFWRFGGVFYKPNPEIYTPQ